MSYILDALQRANAERERGAVPSLHARPLTTPAPEAHVSNRYWLWLAGTLALSAMTAAWWFWRPTPQTVHLATPVETPAPAPAPATSPLTTSVSSGPSPTTEPPPLSVVPPPAAVQPPSQPTATKPAAPVLAPSPVAKASKVAPKATPTTPAVAAASAQKAEQPAIPLLNDLAEDLRRQLPKLTITGAVYSKDPTQRLLLINNLVLTQGSTVAPDLTLEDIQPHQSVFEFRGTRFRVVH